MNKCSNNRIRPFTRNWFKLNAIGRRTHKQVTTSTLGDHREPADICRERGWGQGQKLIGDEGYGPTVIEITAVGQNSILARALSHNGEPARNSHEGSWVLWCRDWREVTLPLKEETGLLPGYTSTEQETPLNGETVFIVTSLGRLLIAKYETLVGNNLWETDEEFLQEGEQVVGWKRNK